MQWEVSVLRYVGRVLSNAKGMTSLSITDVPIAHWLIFYVTISRQLQQWVLVNHHNSQEINIGHNVILYEMSAEPLFDKIQIMCEFLHGCFQIWLRVRILTKTLPHAKHRIHIVSCAWQRNSALFEVRVI